MGRGYRSGRIGEEIKKIVSGMLLRELKDPRLSPMVSVSAVEVSDDSSHATVYVTILGPKVSDEAGAEEKKAVLAAFQSAKGLIRHEVGKQIKLRHVPELSFKIDTSQEYGRHISKIIDQLGIEKEESQHNE